MSLDDTPWSEMSQIDKNANKYKRHCMSWYVKGLRRALVFTPDTDTDGGACAEDITAEIKNLEKLWGLEE